MHMTSGFFRGAKHRRTPAAIALAVIFALAAAFASSPAMAAAHPASQDGLVVPTHDGLLQGKHAEGIDQFLGIPYAAPPVGPLRWQAPQPVQPWHGIRAATAYGNRCPQLASGNGPREDSENCLFLNVFTRGYHPSSRGAGLPVLFMIHGGGLTTGAGDQHDGSLIVNTDHIIVVSINYRLGVFGFLDVPGLATSPLTASGNYGLLDQEAALRWVHRNIAAFGGDAGRVTIAGESAGGWSVCALMTSPLARGLFSGAIMESGSCASRTPAQAQSAGLAFAAQAGCTNPATAAACLRSTPETTLNTDSASYSAEFASGGPELPLPPAQAVSEGDYDRVPLLMGTNHDEARTFTQGFASYTEQQYTQFVDESYGSLARRSCSVIPGAPTPARTRPRTPSGRSGRTAASSPASAAAPSRTLLASLPTQRGPSSTSSTTSMRPD